MFVLASGCRTQRPRLCGPELAKPRNSLLALMSELIGRTTDASQAIYLSGRRPFDILASTRCCAGGAPPSSSSTQIPILVAPCSISATDPEGEHRPGRTVTMHEPMRIYARTRSRVTRPFIRSASQRAQSVSRRPDRHAALCKAKPVAGDSARGARLCQQNAAFPHELITDQWFSESQFESYRGLAACQLGMLTAAMENDTLDGLLGAARSILSESLLAAAAAGRDELVR